MDLHPIAALATEDERRAVDAVLGAPESDAPVTSADAAARRTHLLPVLVALQTRVGRVSEGGLGYACRRLGVPPAEAYGVASFYALLALGDRPRAFAHVCDDIACKAAGAEALCEKLDATLGPAATFHHRADSPKAQPGTTARWARSPCLGLCEQAPAAMVIVARDEPLEQAFGHATPERIVDALEAKTVDAIDVHLDGAGPRRLLARAGKISPESLDAYRSHGGYLGLRRAFDIGSDGIIRELNDAKLVGRGGAAFPTGRKWDAVSKAPVRPHYVVCNADESEPGTFKDRVLLELDPFSIVEAMTIAGFATAASRGYLYLRGEYPLAYRRLTNAIEQSRAKGFLGADIMGKGFAFDIELRRGAGAYICGEETSLFNSIEGLRGEPAASLHFPFSTGSSGSRPRSTTSRHSAPPSTSCAKERLRMALAPSSSASRARSHAPASMRFPSACDSMR